MFDVLADPTTHGAIDGTGWVRESLDGKPVTGTGQIFRMAMYIDGHPDGHYETANRVEVFDPPRAIAWKTGRPVERHRRAPTTTNSYTAAGFGDTTWRRPATAGPK